MADFLKLIMKLEGEGNKGQANIVKRFAGYIIQQHKGKGVDKDLIKTEEIFDEEMGIKKPKTEVESESNVSQ